MQDPSGTPKCHLLTCVLYNKQLSQLKCSPESSEFLQQLTNQEGSWDLPGRGRKLGPASRRHLNWGLPRGPSPGRRRQVNQHTPSVAELDSQACSSCAEPSHTPPRQGSFLLPLPSRATPGKRPRSPGEPDPLTHAVRQPQQSPPRRLTRNQVGTHLFLERTLFQEATVLD